MLVIERGELEAMALLLVESIRRQSSLRGCPIFVVQPRRGDAPSPRTLSQLARLDAVFLSADLNQVWRHHSLMNKVYAAACVEPLVEHSLDTLVFLDTDILVTAPPDILPLHEPQVVGAAPVAEWRIGATGQPAGQLLNGYWKMIFEACGVTELPSWRITTAIDGVEILPYFNSGVILARPDRGLFRSWQASVERLARDPLAQALPRHSQAFYFLEQASFAGTLLAKASREQVCLLEPRCNYPLHAHHLMPRQLRASSLEDVTFLHYHGHFSNLYWLDDINVAEPLRAWLLDRLPLRPRFRLTRGSLALYAARLMSTIPLRPVHHRLVSRIPGLRRTVPHPGIP